MGAYRSRSRRLANPPKRKIVRLLLSSRFGKSSEKWVKSREIVPNFLLEGTFSGDYEYWKSHITLKLQ